MTDWRNDLLDRMRAWPALDAVQLYGSVATGTVDGWSDLDVRVVAHAPLDVEALLDAPLWAWQQAGAQLRLVTGDGRFVDLSVQGAEMVLPRPPSDNALRFDAALAAVRLGRGNLLIGLHLVLGIGREALVESMRTADAATGTVHHPQPTPWDADAAEVAALTTAPLAPETALRALELAGRRRAARQEGFVPDETGLRALLRRADAFRRASR
ncbi:hypothetical protein ACLBWP_14680 [Microbacterium sp. M1A1_1b]